MLILRREKFGSLSENELKVRLLSHSGGCEGQKKGFAERLHPAAAPSSCNNYSLTVFAVTDYVAAKGGRNKL